MMPDQPFNDRAHSTLDALGEAKLNEFAEFCYTVVSAHCPIMRQKSFSARPGFEIIQVLIIPHQAPTLF